MKLDIWQTGAALVMSGASCLFPLSTRDRAIMARSSDNGQSVKLGRGDEGVSLPDQPFRSIPC